MRLFTRAFLGLFLAAAGFTRAEAPRATPQPVPLTRPEMKQFLEDLKGRTPRIPLPELNQERRKELSKLAAKYAEAARVAVRNVRRDGMELLKKLEKDKKIGQDEQHTKGEELQKLTDSHIKDIDAALHAKEQEIMQV